MSIKKSKKILLLACCGLFLFWCFSGGWDKIFQNNNTRVVIEMFSLPDNANSINLGYIEIGDPTYEGIRLANLPFKKGMAKWNTHITNPYQLYTGNFLPGQNAYWLTEPGDNVTISFKGRELKFSGLGSEKFILQSKINDIGNSLQKELSNRFDFITKSLPDYLEWNNYLNKRLNTVITRIESYQNKISPFAYTYIRDIALDNIVEDRSTKFNSFLRYARETGMSLQSICDIYDSTYQANTTAAMLPSTSRSFLGTWDPITFQIARKYYFNQDDPGINSELKRYLLYYDLALEAYQGLAREKFLVEFLTKKMIDNLGFISETEIMLTKYYAEPAYPEYKKYVKEYEMKERVLKNGKPAPVFTLVDASGKSFTKENLKNKVALLNFWSAGNPDCRRIKPTLDNICDKLKSDSNFILLNISVELDRAKWLTSINKEEYTTVNGIHLYTGGQGADHPVIKTYNVLQYPCLYVIDANGSIIRNPLPDPKKDKGEKLIKWIQEQLVLLKDGPYVMHEKSSTIAHWISGASVITKQLDRKNQPALSIQTDEYNKTLDIRLKQNISIEQPEYSRPEKLLVLSDIEGNFGAFRKLLQSNGVIDENYNWIFKNGHLVFNGDMFGKGKQITECLWLIYSLEEKAKAAGGYVHFILGHNEIMSLSKGYAGEKYKGNSLKMNKSYIELYNRDTELGKWLRTKNIMEKIGDLLFVHGGISSQVNDLPLTISEINKFARPWLDRDSIAGQSADKRLALLFNFKDKLSPFVYGGYYLDEEMKVQRGGRKGIDTVYKTSPKVVDETLQKFSISRIMTGHTVVAHDNDVGDTISVHYNGKVINTDTRHLFDKSEALLIEGNRFYRVNDKGEKVQLGNQYLRSN